MLQTGYVYTKKKKANPYETKISSLRRFHLSSALTIINHHFLIFFKGFMFAAHNKLLKKEVILIYGKERVQEDSSISRNKHSMKHIS